MRWEWNENLQVCVAAANLDVLDSVTHGALFWFLVAPVTFLLTVILYGGFWNGQCWGLLSFWNRYITPGLYLCYPVLNIPSYLHLMYPYNHGHWSLFHRGSDGPWHNIGSWGMIFLCWYQSLHKDFHFHPRRSTGSISVLQTQNMSIFG